MVDAGAGGAEVGSGSGRRLALVVATTDYLDASLRRLRAPAEDAAELRDLLADPDVGGFAVTSVINERAHQVRLAIEDFLVDRHQEDLLLLYLSCHGLVDARRRLYFAARDTLKDRLASSGVDSHWLLEQLEDCRARRQVVILDCCFSGAFARGAKGSQDLELGERLVGEGRGRVVLTASRGTEYSFEGEPVDGKNGVAGSVFTSALIEGIRSGGADTDRDGAISVEDAYAFAYDRVRWSGGHQTPQRWLYGAEGSILLARVPSAGEGGDGGGGGSPPAREMAGTAPPTPSPVADSAAPVRPPRRAVASTGSRWRLAAVAAVVAVVAVVAGVLLVQNRETPGTTSTSGDDATGGSFSQDSPWRLRIDDAISASGGNDNGCRVRIIGEATGDVWEWKDFYGTSTFQMRQSGAFRYERNDPGCLLLPQPGDGGLSALPFVWSGPAGDSPVFESPGSVRVEIQERYGTPTCTITLLSDEDARALDRREVTEDATVVESNGPGRVFIARTTCEYRVSPSD